MTNSMNPLSPLCPLCIDLDGTLIKSDVTIESAIALVAKNPFYFFMILFWLLRGRPYMKQKISAHIKFDPANLVYNLELLNFLKDQKAQGRQLVLATASDHTIVKPIADYLGIFDQVLASDGKFNLKGANKAKVLVEKFGEFGFDYAGNSSADFPIWDKSQNVIVVNASKKVESRAQKYKNLKVISSSTNWTKSLIQEFRIHQWAKNILLFIPLIMAHSVADFNLLLKTVFAFIAFSLCASSVYLLNDLVDLESDRKHRSKRDRPLASGNLPLEWAVLSLPILLFSSFFLATFASFNFLICLGIYLVITLAYSFSLKRIAVVDILTLASLYTLRIIAGGAASETSVSKWLLAFSLFFFLSLALIKRFSEIFVTEGNGQVPGRGYSASDKELVSSMGVSSGFLSVLVLALYINSKDVEALYSKPSLIWLLCPIVLYWISRVWLLAHRGQMHDDPIVFAIKDRVSYFVGFVVALVLVAAI